MTEPRAKTAKEVTDEFLAQMRSLARYWAGQKDQTDLQKCEGLVFSILSTIDGCSMGMPSINLVLCPHETDAEFHRGEGENWYEPGMAFNAEFTLHEMLHTVKS